MVRRKYSGQNPLSEEQRGSSAGNMVLKNISRKFVIVAATNLVLIFSVSYFLETRVVAMSKNVQLPQPVTRGKISVEEAIKRRRSLRDFGDKALSLNQISQILWSAQGVTEEGGYKRAAPSAGALYPLEIYLVVGNVEELDAGVYHYNPVDHSLGLILEGNHQVVLAEACLGQMFIADAPISIVITAQYERTMSKYGERGIRYVHIEVGHVGQNICLEAVSLGLGTVTIGAFWDEEVSRVLHLPEEHKPLYVLPVGYPA